MTITYASINSLEEIAFIGGTEYILEFNVYNQAGDESNLSGSDCTWKMSPVGDPSSVTLEYTGTITGVKTFQVTILSADTLSLSGKYIHQPIVTDIATSKEYRSQQGIINIIPANN